ncbi:MAG: hypothetical protein IJ496_05575 [Ruminococcus sp.]|nr:hypothetical protein [Ruminococcus sp.]
MYHPNGFQFKNNGQNKAIGIFMIVLGSVMGISCLLAGLNSIAGSMSAGVFTIVFGVVFIGLFTWMGIMLIRKSKETDRRIQEAMSRYNQAELQWEIQNFTIRMHINPHKGGSVFFTNRFIISTSEGVFPYDQIIEVRASSSRQRYGPRNNYLHLTLTNGESVAVCQNLGVSTATRTQLLEYVSICIQKNPGIQTDIKELL